MVDLLIQPRENQAIKIEMLIFYVVSFLILSLSTSIFVTVPLFLVTSILLVYDLQKNVGSIIYFVLIYIISLYYVMELFESIQFFHYLSVFFMVCMTVFLCTRNKVFTSSNIKFQKVKKVRIPNLKTIALPVIATLLYSIPELFSNQVTKVALFLDGYDNVVHYGVFSKVLSCGSFSIDCPKGSGSSPLDSYPQVWHTFFASLSINLDQSTDQLFTLFTFYKAFSLLFSVIILRQSLMLYKEISKMSSTKLNFFENILVYILPLPVYHFTGWPNYTFSLSLLIFSLVCFYSKRKVLGVCALSVSALCYTLFWPYALLVGLIVFKDGKKRISTTVYFFGLLLPGTKFLYDAYKNQLQNYLSISNSVQFTTILQLMLLTGLLAVLAKRQYRNHFILKLYISFVLLIGIPYQLFMAVNGLGGSYFLQKFLGISPLLICIAFSVLVVSKPKLRNYYREFKILTYPTLVAGLILWSLPIYVMQSPRQWVSNDRVFAKLLEFQYGAKASPINSVIRNYHIAFNSNSPYSVNRLGRAEVIGRKLAGRKESIAVFPEGIDPNFYHTAQWVNAVNNSWYYSVQNALDEAVKSKITGQELIDFFSSKSVSESSKQLELDK